MQLDDEERPDEDVDEDEDSDETEAASVGCAFGITISTVFGGAGGVGCVYVPDSLLELLVFELVWMSGESSMNANVFFNSSKAIFYI